MVFFSRMYFVFHSVFSIIFVAWTSLQFVLLLCSLCEICFNWATELLLFILVIHGKFVFHFFFNKRWISRRFETFDVRQIRNIEPWHNLLPSHEGQVFKIWFSLNSHKCYVSYNTHSFTHIHTYTHTQTHHPLIFRYCTTLDLT